MTDERLKMTGALLYRHRRELFVGGIPWLLMAAFLCREDGRCLEGLVLTSFLWAAAVFDYRYGLIFDRLTFSMAVLALCFRLHGLSDVPSLVFGFSAGGAPLFLLAVISCGGFGGGDVKLASAGGLWLGWQGALLALAIASWSGGLAAVYLLASGKRKRRDAVAFGPFLSFGFWMAFFFGERLLAMYEAFCFG